MYILINMYTNLVHTSVHFPSTSIPTVFHVYTLTFSMLRATPVTKTNKSTFLKIGIF